MINIDNKTVTPAPFRGALDGVVTSTLRTLDTNPMANAVGIDLFAMVAPRTYVDTKERNKYAGAETFFREFTGTLIVCLSAVYFAKGISKIANKMIKPDVAINTKSWFSEGSLDFLTSVWNKTKSSRDYVASVLDGMSGVDGNMVKNFKDINWKKIEWVDEKKWSNFKWDNPKFKNIHENMKDKESIISTINELIDDKSISTSDSRKLLQILELRLTNALGADKISAKISDKSLSTSLHNLLRDSVDLGRDVFTNPAVKPDEALAKIKQINKIKSVGALGLASTLGLTNQYINRKITEKRTGTKGFVGDSDYQNQVENKKSGKDTSKGFMLAKLLASAGMAAMAIGVMKVKSPADFMRKLEFTGPVTSGNAIKTVYAATLIGRFLASDSKDELRETVTRDYLGFLNWLVFGGFAAKGMAKLLDPKRENIFNGNALKSHNEVAAKGLDFAKKNMWKLNMAHATGLAYSTVALGILLPKLNILITNRKNKAVMAENDSYTQDVRARISFEKWQKQFSCGLRG